MLKWLQDFRSLGLALLVACGSAVAQEGQEVESIALPVLDMVKIANEDAISDIKGNQGGYRFAIGRNVDIVPGRNGAWRVRDGRMVWQFRVESLDAGHLNFGFEPFRLPAGAVLRISTLDGLKEIGPYTDAQNSRLNAFWTPVLLGHDALIELSVPVSEQDKVNLRLIKIGQGYRGFGARPKHCKSGACNMDVACLAADDPWNGPRRATAAYTRGATDTCTGSLVNNTANDRRMLFATATHCGMTVATAASIVVYWNYESPTCRLPLASGQSPVLPKPSTNQSGATFLAATNNPFAGAGEGGTRSDWTLLELTTPANPAFNLHWAGWDRRSGAALCAATADPNSTLGLCAGVHHPGVDEKRITFVERNFEVGNITSATGVHWHAFWDPTPPIVANIPSPQPTFLPPGVTEPGSSGSPLYNASQRLVGVLSGGPSACGATGDNLSDFYGQLAHSWEGLGTPATAMKTHLDPGNSNAEFLNGINQCNQPNAPSAANVVVNGANRIDVSWTVAPGISTYRVLRSNGACPGNNYAQIAEVSTGTTFSDTTVSGGSTYSYRVVSVDTVQPCESAQSSCASATATGVCSLAPSFSGIAGASSAGSPSCGIDLNWTAAAANCGAGGMTRYNVFRSSTPSFTPSAANTLITCVSGTNLRDTMVSNGVPYHYIVRAEDSSGAGNGVCAAGLQDTNIVSRSAAATGPDSDSFLDALESGTANWAVAGTGGGADWTLSTAQANSPTRSWFVPDPAVVSERFLTLSAPLVVPSSAGVTLEFFHRYDTEATFDGGVLEYSLDGTLWTDILAAQGTVPANATRFLAGAYNAPMGGSGAFPNRAAWHGAFNTSWLRVAVNLGDFSGRNVRFRWRFASDSSVARTGWFVDDVRVYFGSNCAGAPADLLFRSGFENVARP